MLVGLPAKYWIYFLMLIKISGIYLAMMLLVILIILTILKGKNCVLLNPVQQLIKIVPWLHLTFFRMFIKSNKFY